MTGICLCAILPSIKLLYSLAMKTLLAVAAVSLAICAGCDRPPAINMDMPGMREAMEQMDNEKLDPLKENAFDLEFIRQMIPHHGGAVAMAKDLLTHEANAELKTLAENIIRSQQSEIEQMR